MLKITWHYRIILLSLLFVQTVFPLDSHHKLKMYNNSALPFVAVGAGLLGAFVSYLYMSTKTKKINDNKDKSMFVTSEGEVDKVKKNLIELLPEGERSKIKDLSLHDVVGAVKTKIESLEKAQDDNKSEIIKTKIVNGIFSVEYYKLENFLERLLDEHNETVSCVKELLFLGESINADSGMAFKLNFPNPNDKKIEESNYKDVESKAKKLLSVLDLDSKFKLQYIKETGYILVVKSGI